MQQHDVVIAGGGPTGLMLAAELALASVDVAIVERRPDQALAGSRAGGLLTRTIEIFDQRGIADRFIAVGKKMSHCFFATHQLELADQPTRHPYGLAIWQNQIERILADWVAELPVTFYRAHEVTDVAQDPDGVTITAGREPLRARYLVGCDGGRSFVRKRAGIDFAGWDASHSSIIAECVMTDPELGLHRDAKGVYAIGKLDDGRVRVVVRDDDVTAAEPTLDDLRAALVKLYGSDFDVRDPTWLSRFGDTTRQATRYRQGRVFLAGDAAHVHSPVGGQGLNTGVQDAVNLGWKLARVVHGTAPDALLDTYHAERHPVAARALRLTMAGTALNRVDDRVAAVNEVIGDLFTVAEARKRYAAIMSGLEIQYGLGEGHPLLGRRMPDLELDTGRVYELLHRAQPVELDVTAMKVKGPWVLPVIGEVPAPRAVSIRPDGYVERVAM